MVSLIPSSVNNSAAVPFSLAVGPLPRACALVREYAHLGRLTCGYFSATSPACRSPVLYVTLRLSEPFPFLFFSSLSLHPRRSALLLPHFKSRGPRFAYYCTTHWSGALVASVRSRVPSVMRFLSLGSGRLIASQCRHTGSV